MDRVQNRANEISTGVFLIGLAIIFLRGDFFPGILFVIGIASIARALGEGKAWYAAQGGLWAIGIGLLFTFGFSLPLMLILIGISIVFGQCFKPPSYHDEKAKNEDVQYV